MAEKDKEGPASTPSGAAAARRRQERLAAALRANLARRKAQARERAVSAEPPAGKGRKPD